MSNFKINSKKTTGTLFLLIGAIALGSTSLFTSTKQRALHKQLAASKKDQNEALIHLTNITIAAHVKNELSGWKSAPSLATKLASTLTDLPDELALQKVTMLRLHTPEPLPQTQEHAMVIQSECSLMVKERASGGGVLAFPYFIETARRTLGTELQYELHETGEQKLTANQPNLRSWTLKNQYPQKYLLNKTEPTL